MTTLLTSLSVVKYALGIPQGDTSQDVDVQQKLNAADAAIKRWCHRVLVQTVMPPEYPRGSIIPEIATRQRPICVYPATGNLTNGSAVVTNISPGTGNLIVGMPCVIGATWNGASPLPTGTVILSVDSATQVTLTNPVTASGTGASLSFGLSVWIDGCGGFGFGIGSGVGGPYNAGTELRMGIDYAPKIDGSDGIAHSGILIRLRGWAGTSTSSGYWDDATLGGGLMGLYGTLTAVRCPGWPSGKYGETKVSYTAGYATIPPDLAQCCVEFTVALRRLTPYGGLWPSSSSFQAFSFGVLADSKDQQIATIRQKLTPFRELSV